jgi:hypothetical protein
LNLTSLIGFVLPSITHGFVIFSLCDPSFYGRNHAKFFNKFAYGYAMTKIPRILEYCVFWHG